LRARKDGSQAIFADLPALMLASVCSPDRNP
jgi:hypothetical protein